ncbi:hypothetical protein [Fervidobacterium islandicum]|uniref:hypothetical protein n=1 Tax=Fervidobacterium islandicum TaxID=2423 RepID=UPI003A790EB5
MAFWPYRDIGALSGLIALAESYGVKYTNKAIRYLKKFKDIIPIVEFVIIEGVNAFREPKLLLDTVTDKYSYEILALFVSTDEEFDEAYEKILYI